MYFKINDRQEHIPIYRIDEWCCIYYSLFFVKKFKLDFPDYFSIDLFRGFSSMVTFFIWKINKLKKVFYLARLINIYATKLIIYFSQCSAIINWKFWICKFQWKTQNWNLNLIRARSTCVSFLDFVLTPDAMFARVFIFLLVMFFRCGICNVVKRSSACRGNVCEFRWIIDYKFTMMWYNTTSEGTVYQPIVQDSKGFIRRRSTTPNCSETHEAVSLDGSDNSNNHDIAVLYIMKYFILVNVQVMLSF